MKKIIWMITCVIFLSGCSDDTLQENNKLESDLLEKTVKNKYNKDISISIDENLILKNLEEVCMNVRNFGSTGEDISSKYLKDKLKEYGYIPNIEEFTVYKQTFESTLDVENYKDYFIYNSETLGAGKNIIAKRDNHSDTKKTIYLTAHYDTTEDTTGVIDNGTGVSVLLEVARQIKSYDSSFNIVVAFLGAEEYYRSGSRAFVSSLSDKEKGNTIGCINIDMVGEKNAGDIIMGNYTGDYNILSLMINNALENPLVVMEGGYSDDLSFYFGKMPTVTLTNKESEPEVSKEKDQFQHVNLEELKNLSNMVTKFLLNFDMNTYNELLDGSKGYTSNKSKDKIGDMNGFSLKKINSALIENGYDVKTEYIYGNENGSKFTMTEQRKIFIEPSVYKDFDIFKDDSNYEWLYSIDKRDDDNHKIWYATDSYFGEIKGDISIDEALNVLSVYHRKEYKRIFGEYP